MINEVDSESIVNIVANAGAQRFMTDAAQFESAECTKKAAI